MTRTKRIAIGKEIELNKITNDWFQTYSKLVENETYHVLLESGRGGRYSIIGMTPWAILTGKNNVLTIKTKDGVAIEKGPLLHSLRNWLTEYIVDRNKDLPDFQGGIIGQFSYDIVREIERIPTLAEDDLNTEDLLLMAFNDLVVIDHQNDTIWFITIVEEGSQATGQEQLSLMEQQWKDKTKTSNGSWYFQALLSSSEDSLDRSFTEEEFVDAVKKNTRLYKCRRCFSG